MGKGYTGLVCVYCGEHTADTADHVIARAFFLENKRHSIPKVPACRSCNSTKSRLEHVLTATLPFGARHADASEALGKVGARLAKNQKLSVDLASKREFSLRSVDSGPWFWEMDVPVDHKAIEELGQFLVKGLAFHHWNVVLGSDDFVRASFLNVMGRHLFEPLFSKTAARKVKQDLGQGVFVYEGVQSNARHELTLWKMSLFSAEFRGDPSLTGDRSSTLYGISAPKGWTVTEQILDAWN